MRRVILTLLTLSLLHLATVAYVWADDAEQALEPFLSKHCIRCHGPKEQNADRRFDKLSFDFSKPQNGELLQEVLDQLNLGEMPPEDEPQPTPDEVRKVVGILTAKLAEAREAARSHSAGRVVLRRLNRAEYLNTIRDLFQLNMTDFDPTVAFPADDSIEGFDNIGEGLLTSDFLLA